MKKIFGLLAVGTCLLAFTGCSERVNTPEVSASVAWITTPEGDVECIIGGTFLAEGGNRAEPNTALASNTSGYTDCNWNTLTEKGSETPDNYKEFQGTMMEQEDGTQTFCIINYSYKNSPSTDCNWE